MGWVWGHFGPLCIVACCIVPAHCAKGRTPVLSFMPQPLRRQFVPCQYSRIAEYSFVHWVSLNSMSQNFCENTQKWEKMISLQRLSVKFIFVHPSLVD